VSAVRFPLWVYGAVAAGIASLAAAAGTVMPGMGVAVAAGGSLMWTAYNARRFGKVKIDG
jgi:hypothetical protein